MPCSLPHGRGHGGEGLGVQVVRRGVDQVAGAVDLLDERGGTLCGRLERLVARLAAEQGDLGERQLGAVAVLLVLRRELVLAALVRGEGVRAEQCALGDGLGVLDRRDRQREAGLLRTGQRTRGGTGGAAQCLAVECRVLLRDRTESDRDDDRDLETVRRVELGHFALGTGGAQGLQDGGELSAERLVHGLGARCDDRALGSLGDADDECVGAQRRRTGSAESESSHGGEISLPLSSLSVEGWADRARRIVDAAAMCRE